MSILNYGTYLAGDNSDFGYGGLSIGVEKLGAMANNTTILLCSS